MKSLFYAEPQESFGVYTGDRIKPRTTETPDKSGLVVGVGASAGGPPIVTGEEAYSVAILFVEALESLSNAPTLQIR